MGGGAGQATSSAAAGVVVGAGMALAAVVIG
jgi:hypothetical protein